jgi:CBS-domain-containing membrane protein
MPSLVTRMIELKAADVMTRNPVTLKGNDSLISAVSTLKRHQITGAPVVDEEHRLIGVFSLGDAVRNSRMQGELLGDSVDRPVSETMVGPLLIPDTATVVDRMSPTVSGASPEELLVDVSRKMCLAHWHRIPVVTDDGRLVGIISTMDVLAALVNMFDEMR